MPDWGAEGEGKVPHPWKMLPRVSSGNSQTSISFLAPNIQEARSERTCLESEQLPLRIEQKTLPMPLPTHSQKAHDSLDWNFLLQLWYLLGVGDWKLLARCRAVVEKRKRQGRRGAGERVC